MNAASDRVGLALPLRAEANDPPRAEEGHTIFVKALGQTFVVLSAVSAGVVYLARWLAGG